MAGTVERSASISTGATTSSRANCPVRADGAVPSRSEVRVSRPPPDSRDRGVGDNRGADGERWFGRYVPLA
jgi:hypothetical protein